MLTVYFSGFLILMNLMVSLTLFPLYIRFRGGNDFMIGLQSSVFTLGSVILRLYFGPLADSIGRKFPLILGAFIFATAPLLVWLSPNFFIMALVRIYQAVGMATFLSAAGSSIADMAPDKMRGTAIGVYRSLASAAVMAGPFFGYRLITLYGYPSFFIAFSISSLLAMILLLTIHLPEGSMKSTGKSVKPKDLISLLGNRELRGCYTGIMLTSASSGIVMTYLAVYFITLPDAVPPPHFFALYAGCGIIASSFSGYLSDKLGRNVLILPLIFIFGIGLIFLGNPGLGGVFVFLAAPVFVGIGYPGGMTVFSTWIVDSAPEELRASALSFQESSIDVGNTAGILIFGILATTIYYPVLFTAAGLITLIYPLIIKAVRR